VQHLPGDFLRMLFSSISTSCSSSVSGISASSSFPWPPAELPTPMTLLGLSGLLGALALAFSFAFCSAALSRSAICFASLASSSSMSPSSSWSTGVFPSLGSSTFWPVPLDLSMASMVLW
jgi:hypothetical protein